MYTIDVIINTEVVRSYRTDCKEIAKQYYYSNEARPYQYTRFAIDGNPLTTARAKAYLGAQPLKEAF